LIVTKRDGRKVEFDKTKIENAILKAHKSIYHGENFEDIQDFAAKVAFDIESSNSASELSVEDIQDMVERKLMASRFKTTARAYVNYRFLHEMARNQYQELMQTVSEKLTANNIQNQNANVDEASFGGRIGEASDVVTRRYALEYLVSPMAKANHENNEVYIHDLNAYAVGSHNCLSIPFDDLLANGFNTRQTDVRPAQSINTAFQLVAVIFQLQSLQQFGGVSATHLDWTMVPYVRKSFYKHFKDGVKYCLRDEWDEHWDSDFNDSRPIDWDEYKNYPEAYEYALDMTTKEIYQAVEGMYHNLNTLQSRSGNQLPFTSINYGTCTLPEGRMVTKALLDVSIKGIGKLHRTSIFPCGIFQCMKGVNRKPEDPNYDLFQLALKSTSLRLYPNYANVDWSNNAGYDINDPRTYFSTMGKRKLIAHVKPFEPRQRVSNLG
jgi:ribonucleoside-triphosphate reductase